MISNHLSLVEQHRQYADSISERTAQFLAAGGNIAQLPKPAEQTDPTETLGQDRSRNHPQAPQAAHHSGRT